MFVVPIHAVDLELQIPDRFCVNDVWEVVDESSADVIATLEGKKPFVDIFGGIRGLFSKIRESCSENDRI